MSLPPTSSPPIKSCGKVGQLETFGKLALILGLERISTNEKGLPHEISNCVAFEENPH